MMAHDSIPQRPLGRTGVKVSALGVGGHHLDLWQVHGVCFDNDPELAYAKGGVLEALDKAKKQGRTRFVGFTGHKDPAIHLDMMRRGYKFDTVQMPLNALDASFRSFEKQ